MAKLAKKTALLDSTVAEAQAELKKTFCGLYYKRLPKKGLPKSIKAV